MHHCLSVDEILLEIFSQVLLMDRLSFPPEKSRTVAGLARSCRTFRGPALAVLWRELASVARLFRVLPATRWRLKETAEGRPDGVKLVILVCRRLGSNMPGTS
jgi:hypothetical protein